MFRQPDGVNCVIRTVYLAIIAKLSQNRVVQQGLCMRILASKKPMRTLCKYSRICLIRHLKGIRKK